MPDFSKFWISQFQPPTPDPGPTACFRACRQMSQTIGREFPESTEHRIQLANAEFDHGDIAPDINNFYKAKQYLWDHLSGDPATANPCIIGIHYKPGSQNRDGITDHFVLAVGQVAGGAVICCLNPGARREFDARLLGCNFALLEDPVNHVWRVISPWDLRASASMVVYAQDDIDRMK